MLENLIVYIWHAVSYIAVVKTTKEINARLGWEHCKIFINVKTQINRQYHRNYVYEYLYNHDYKQLLQISLRKLKCKMNENT